MTPRWLTTSLVLSLLLVVAARAQEEASAPAELSVWNRSIVTFRATVRGVTPRQRVQNSKDRIQDHLRTAAGTPTVSTYATTIDGISGVIVAIGDDVAFGLVPGDVDPESSSTLEQTVAEAAERLGAALAAREQQRRPWVLARGLGLTLAVALACIVAVRLIVAGREVAVRKLTALLHRRQLALGGVDIAPALATVERATFRVLSWSIMLVIAYLALTYVLHLFPYTQPVGARLGDYLVDLVGEAFVVVAQWAPRILAVIAVLLVTRAVSLWVRRLLAEVEHGIRKVTWLAQEQARATRALANTVIWLMGIAAAYSMLPWSGSKIFQGMSLVLGLGVSLASAGLLNQWISGIVILYSRSFRVGEFVKIGEVEGFVHEMGSLATKIRTLRREEITIPNAVVTAEKLTNFSRLTDENGPLLSISISIGYDVPWQQVRALLLQAAGNTSGVRRDPAPRVLHWELSDFYVQHLLYVHLERAEERAAVRSELNTKILDAFAAAGVQIMSPHFEAQPDRPVIAARFPFESAAAGDRR